MAEGSLKADFYVLKKAGIFIFRDHPAKACKKGFDFFYKELTADSEVYRTASEIFLRK
jgi:hypothetical protein